MTQVVNWTIDLKQLWLFSQWEKSTINII